MTYWEVFNKLKSGGGILPGQLIECNCCIHDICDDCIVSATQAELEMNRIPSTAKIITISEEKKFVVIDKKEKSIEFYASLEDAKRECAMNLTQDGEFTILKMVSKVRPKPIDADVTDY